MKWRAVRNTWVLILMVVLVFINTGCGSEYPDELPLGGIQGKLIYTGEVHTKLKNPAAGVYAFATWPPEGLPHASRLFLSPEFPEEGLIYELKNLDPYQYIILAMIVDLDSPISLDMDISNPESLPPAFGAYPSLLTFSNEPVEVFTGEITPDIDIKLLDL